MDIIESVESIMLSGYRQMGGVYQEGQPQGEPLQPEAMPQCGSCYHFPGDRQRCPATLDTVSRKVRACGEYA